MTTLSSVGFYLIVACWLCAQKLATMQTDDLEEMLRVAIRNSMVRSELSIKDAAFRIGRHESDLRKALKGDPSHYLPFVEIVLHWPFSFWISMTPEIVMVVARKRMAEVRDMVGA
jgi:hypothetical protein